MTLFQLMQWRAAIKLESLGMKHSSGRSVRKHAALELGMPANSKAQAVIDKIKEEIKKCGIPTG